jgi:Baseplate J-like protein
MATAPQILLRDGSGYTTNLVFTTNQESIVIQGTVNSSTSDIQVSINGAAYVSDSTLVDFNLPEFTVPNLNSYPDGLALTPGLNTIRIRTIDIVGGVSVPSTVSVTLISQSSVLQVETPSGIRVRRLRGSTKILAALPVQRFSTSGVPLPSNFVGYNFYASTSAGGTTGYYKINATTVSAKSTIYEENATQFAADQTIFDAGDEFLAVQVLSKDEFGNVTSTKLDQTYATSVYNNKIRFNSTFEDYSLTEFIEFNHVRTGTSDSINDDQWSGVADTDPLYYVVTGVYFDPLTGEEVESAFSQEVLGSPLIIDTSVKSLPGRTQFQVVTDYVSAIQRVNTEISLLPGSTTRDVSIDPFSSEAERLYFLVDFVNRTQSFLTLLQIDDANGDGVSDPVSGSSYKTALKAALGYTTNDAVQSLIDSAFDKLAGNINKTRLAGRPAFGQEVFYTTTKPAFDLPIPTGTIVSTTADSSLGIPSVRFRVGGSYVMLAATSDNYYNFDTKRYEITVDIIAETVGSDGNRPAGQITNVQGVSGFQVTNTEATVFGSDRESNSDLATRCLLGYSVDTGTAGGYASTASDQIGIVKSKIVKSGDALMMRDYDEVRHKHIGGKVDIWIQGLQERQVFERFAFTYDIARDIVCIVLDATNLIFRVQDSRVTTTTPITEILDNLTLGFGVRNVTQGLNYLLSGVTILDYQTFQINASIPGQVVTNFDDVVTADYRFRSINQFQFSFQPVRRVVSVVGEISGALNNSLGYTLYKTADPLLEGESTISTDYLSINQLGGVPSGASIQVNNEIHVLIGAQPEPLGSIGVNTKSIRVFSSDRTVEYNGPDTTIPDYEVIEGEATTPAKISRTATSNIVNGSTVSVDYAHDENFTVTYVINDLLQQLQRTVNSKRHTTADVIIKQAIDNSVVIETTVQLLSGATKDLADPDIRTNTSLETNKRLIGRGLAQADIIRAIDESQGVDYLVVPMARMSYADGSRKLREGLTSAYLELTSLNSGSNIAYLLTNPLAFPTTDGGGLTTEHKGVFQDDETMTLVSSLSQVALAAKQAFIIGASGAVINGYTDTATLVAAGFTTAATQQAELLRRTANHIVISIAGYGVIPDLPTNHSYTVSYVIRGDSGSHDIPAASVEFVTLGNFTITYSGVS